MYRPIKDTDGRYVINEDGRVLDTTPFYMEHIEWQWETIDPTQPRELNISDDDEFIYIKNGKQTSKNLFICLKETFPELYDIDEETRRRITESYRNDEQRTYSISLRDFNRMIFPNELIQIYDTTQPTRGKWRKPTVIRPNERGIIVLRKNRKYFAIGTRNIIHFRNDGCPYNTRYWAERPDTTWYNDNKKKKDNHGDDLF